jgi:selenocysteine lyase/cysteine desulfurase
MKDGLMIKSDFEIFKLNNNLVYLDSASTTLVPNISVIAMANFLNTIVVSSRRGAYDLAVKGGSVVKDVRKDLATFLQGDPVSFSFQKSIPSTIGSLVLETKEERKDHYLTK